MRLFARPKAAPVVIPYKLLSVLLLYPDEPIVEAEDEINSAVAGLPASPVKDLLERFCAYWTSLTATERAQNYVTTFDLQKRSSLYLSYYVFGDQRQRGMALLRLKRLYAAAGFVLTGRELADYLPLMLEFAELAPVECRDAVLGEYRPAIEVLRQSLRERESPYADLLDALCSGLPELDTLQGDSVRRVIAEGPPSEQVGLDPFMPPEIMSDRGARR